MLTLKSGNYIRHKEIFVRMLSLMQNYCTILAKSELACNAASKGRYRLLYLPKICKKKKINK